MTPGDTHLMPLAHIGVLDGRGWLQGLPRAVTRDYLRPITSVVRRSRYGSQAVAPRGKGFVPARPPYDPDEPSKMTYHMTDTGHVLFPFVSVELPDVSVDLLQLKVSGSITSSEITKGD